MNIRMERITKIFPGVIANDNIDFSIEEGEIHALVGENGAGKTTLMRILHGELKPDSGKIYINGKETEITDPRTAIRLGIGMVHQHFMLIPSLTVLENIILGEEPMAKFDFLDYRSAKNMIRNILNRYGFELNLNSRIMNISVGEQQKVEIIKLLYRNAEVLIFDEPTSVLTPQEVESLFEIFRRLKYEKKSIVFITHKLEEVMKIADRITVLKSGKVQGTLKKDEADIRKLANLMIGNEIPKITIEPSKVGKPIFSISNLTLLDKNGIKRLDNISMSVRSGEIFGIAGVEGNGQDELIKVIMGLKIPKAGKIKLMGEDITKLGVKERRIKGIAYIPEDPYRIGSSVELTVWENAISNRMSHDELVGKFFLDFENIYSFSRKLVDQFEIKTPSIFSKVGELSGGNLQKLIVGREVSTEPKIILAAHPTKGLDIKATNYVRNLLLKLKNSGKAIILISTNLDELLEISDRLAVMYKGKMVGELERGEFDKERIGLMMAGKVG
ncbi:MAG: ABC transporter ATP-binding protein [Thermotoga sp.]|nr:MAG: ABC transporter ATP-binding protein [Thermotoga sp.]HDM70677.1 ABC transporter ATP-binding protein [Thermotogales bacterium]